MDFEALLSILLVILYFVFQIIGGKKKGQRRQAPAPQRAPVPQRTAEPGTGESEWERALREIRTALGEPKPEPSPQRQAPAPRPLPQQNQQASPTRRPFPEVKPAPLPRIERTLERTHFEERSLEDAFELRAPVKTTAQPMVPSRPAPTQAKPASQSPPSRPQGGRTMLDLLREPGTARNAIILSEILGPPRSRNPR